MSLGLVVPDGGLTKRRIKINLHLHHEICLDASWPSELGVLERLRVKSVNWRITAVNISFALSNRLQKHLNICNVFVCSL